MLILLKIIWEAIRQALSQLRTNKLRSSLSLMGISIGIFCIIGVGAAVDSLQSNVIGSFEKLGDDVVYINQFDWGEDPGDNYWKWRRRPNPDYDDYKAIREKVKSAGISSFHVFVGVKTAKFKSKSVEGSFVIGATEDYGKMFGFEFENGRYFSPTESVTGSNKCILGHTVATELFGSTNVVGQKINLMGRSLEVVGVLTETGESLVNIMNFDEGIVLPFELSRRMMSLNSLKRNGNSMLSLKAAEGISREQLTDEVTGVMRAIRKLKPAEENNFAVNNVSIITSLLDSVFEKIGYVGIVVGLFAILVGIFSVANIMFVSVKERTNIIGIKKALGAKRYIILLEFLIEASILCLLGGIIGLSITFIVTKIASNYSAWEIFLSSGNIIKGVLLSIAIGITSGIIPAWQAAQLDPVVAIRSK